MIAYRIRDETLPGELQLVHIRWHGHGKVHRVCVNRSLVHIEQIRLESCKETEREREGDDDELEMAGCGTVAVSDALQTLRESLLHNLLCYNCHEESSLSLGTPPRPGLTLPHSRFSLSLHFDFPLLCKLCAFCVYFSPLSLSSSTPCTLSGN